jgi:hypothetical protein
MNLPRALARFMLGSDLIAGKFGASKAIDSKNSPISCGFKKIRLIETCV